MKAETFFKRYEYKYLISRKDMHDLIAYMDEYMEQAEFFKSNVMSLYYDTDDYRLIRRSIEKPVYKEKLRLRSYGVPEDGTNVFLEIKKKYKHVVYKRRAELTEKAAEAFMSSNPECKSQIEREIKYMKDFYGKLEPKVLVSTERFSYVGRSDASLRITFDTDILWRDYDLNLEKGIYGNPLLDKDTVLMEIKAPMAIPLWMVSFLNARQIRRTSFSKYGNAYLEIMKKFSSSNEERKIG